MTEQLKPCPFCGGINVIHSGYHMYCHACGAEGPDADNMDESAATEAWNTRTALSQPEPDAVKAAWLAGYIEGEREALAQPAEVEPVADERASLIYDSATHAAAMAVFMTRMDAERPDSDDLGISGWLQEAEYRIKRRAKQSLESLLQTAPQTKAEQQEPVGVVG